MWIVGLVIVFFVGVIAGVFIGAILAAAGSDAARYHDGGSVS